MAGGREGSPEDPVEAVRALVEHVARALGFDGRVDIDDGEDEVVATLHGEELGLFIGRHGQTIDAVQHLAYRAALDAGLEGKRVTIDAEGYRARRREALERQAEQAAEEAIRYGRPVSLDAMTATERKLVHEFLRERGDVETHSEGDEPDRHLVVAPTR
ncbi:MAG TPA: R3H domain-containing nucleic acid-binding protein [Solirubrobacteraceae bacterium]|nr:R3H domain-containing nucleic acid-binding protein [Solirubrobacteraceae bacterium]